MYVSIKRMKYLGIKVIEEVQDSTLKTKALLKEILKDLTNKHPMFVD